MYIKKAALYMRVSTEEQAKEGFSIDAQRRVLEAQAIVGGYNATEVYADEGKSGKNLRRPQVQKLIADCKEQKISAVIVWRLDRLSRSLRDTLTLIEDVFTPNGIPLISATESIDTSTPSGRLMINVLASFAQNEREVNQQRVSMVMQDLAKQCRHLGGVPPFGYRVVDGFYQLDPVTAPAVEHLFQMFIDGSGYSAMLAWLNENGFTTARGKPFHKNSLYDILGNEKYTGVYIYNRTVPANKDGVRNNRLSKAADQIIRIPGGIPAIITPETWQKAQAIREENKKRPGAFRAKQVYLLSGLCVCDVCKSKMTIVSGSKDRNGTIQRYYACPNHCVAAARKEHIEAAVFKILEAYLAQEDMVRQAVQLAHTFMPNRHTSRQRHKVQRQLQMIDLQIKNLLETLKQSGGSAPASVLSELQALEAQQQGLADLNNTLTAPSYTSADELLSILRTAAHAKDRPPAEQKPLIQKAVSHVAVSDTAYRLYLDCCLSGGAEPSVEILLATIRQRKSISKAYSLYCDTNDINITLHINSLYHNH
ncbi:MAG: recombinase family protein, partial [Clostridia bacterium]|nr:recombinase family protein [Clostridia bacterium]